jgi:hypothetical protein
MMNSSPNNIVPSQPLLISGIESSPRPHMTITFQIDEERELSKEINSKWSTGKKEDESFAMHEIRAWSSFVDALTVEKALGELDKQSADSYVSEKPRNQERTNRSRSALIDRKKRHYHLHGRLTWRSLFGTMSDVNHIFTYKRFLRGLPCLQTLIIFIDSCFRGIGQVMFANNPLSGLVSLEPAHTRNL